jgi:hypothetical protein
MFAALHAYVLSPLASIFDFLANLSLIVYLSRVSMNPSMNSPSAQLPSKQPAPSQLSPPNLSFRYCLTQLRYVIPCMDLSSTFVDFSSLSQAIGPSRCQPN